MSQLIIVNYVLSIPLSYNPTIQSHDKHLLMINNRQGINQIFSNPAQRCQYLSFNFSKFFTYCTMYVSVFVSNYSQDWVSGNTGQLVTSHISNSINYLNLMPILIFRIRQKIHDMSQTWLGTQAVDSSDIMSLSPGISC